MARVHYSYVVVGDGINGIDIKDLESEGLFQIPVPYAGEVNSATIFCKLSRKWAKKVGMKNGIVRIHGLMVSITKVIQKKKRKPKHTKRKKIQ